MKESGKRLGPLINRKMGRAIGEYSMIREKDRLLVAFSGGKDSATLIDFLVRFQKKAPVHFEIFAVHVDAGFGGETKEVQAFLEDSGLPYSIVREPIAKVVIEKSRLKKETPCALCSKMRRGILYSVAKEQNCNVLALGHHADDLIQTFFMNAFFSGKTGTMSPHYMSKQYGLRVIRPLSFVFEHEIIGYNEQLGRRFTTCEFCETEGEFRRKWASTWIDSIVQEVPAARESILAALKNIHQEEMLDSRLWKNSDFSAPDG